MARIDKINGDVMRELANVIRELKDSRIPMMTSVVAVNVTNDLRYAKVYVSVMGDEETKKQQEELNRLAKREVGKTMAQVIGDAKQFKTDMEAFVAAFAVDSCSLFRRVEA